MEDVLVNVVEDGFFKMAFVHFVRFVNVHFFFCTDFPFFSIYWFAGGGRIFVFAPHHTAGRQESHVRPLSRLSSNLQLFFFGL